ncbi:MAG: hypothetical protein ACFFF4_10250 [Candidatus Thorarchaeota archaeon]
MTVSMKQAFEVREDGTSEEVEVSRVTLSSNSVFCIVDNSNKSIYLWMGSNCGVRKKFAGAQTASQLRTEQGNGFRVRPLDEGEEPSDFLSIE